MKRFLWLALLGSSSLIAQFVPIGGISGKGRASILPYGAWNVCAGPSRALAAHECESLLMISGTEQYLLVIRGDIQSATYFEYVLDIKLVGRDDKICFKGVIKREDNKDGWSSFQISVGGVVESFQISWKSLGVIGE